MVLDKSFWTEVKKNLYKKENLLERCQQLEMKIVSLANL